MDIKIGVYARYIFTRTHKTEAVVNVRMYYTLDAWNNNTGFEKRARGKKVVTLGV